MNRLEDGSVDTFDADVLENAGYRYTTNAGLSSQLANRRMTDATLSATDLGGKRVIDIGCGDGTYTIELFDRGNPASILGIDPARRAIEAARQKAPAGRAVDFQLGSAYDLSFDDGAFDVACLRGVLHHLDEPGAALREALRVAPHVVILEPNGHNPALKVIEHCSRYHVQHGEKSYASSLLGRWARDAGATHVTRRWVGMVPFFCADWLARALKFAEPGVEALPGVNRIACAVCVLVASRTA